VPLDVPQATKAGVRPGGAALAQRLDGLLAAQGRAGQDAGDRVVPQPGQQAVGFLVAGL
jgi:hypothetical protein